MTRPFFKGRENNETYQDHTRRDPSYDIAPPKGTTPGLAAGHHFGSCCQSDYSVLLQGDGKIITVGYPNSESSDSDFLLARLTTTGALDTTFGIAGKVRTSLGDLNDGANAALLQSDGKIVAVGYHPTATNRFSEFAAARYLGSSSVLSLASAISRKTQAARAHSTHRFP
ncbi:MAG TPA: delta-60 repeat domain-containing protein [Chthoniobacterales bacterium]